MNRNIFCLAPWTHSHINMNGKRALCCHAKSFEDIEDISLDSFWNSEIMKKTRLDMLRGAPDPKFCSACIGDQSCTDLPKNTFEDASILDFLIEHTDEDGRFSGQPTFFDYRISNICNLSCRMCSPEASSKIETAVRKLDSTSINEVNELDRKQFENLSLIKPELLSQIEKGDVQKLYWASGEAFLQKDHWDVIDSCIKLGKASAITLNYNSNLAFDVSYLSKNKERLESFKAIFMGVSIDGVGDTLEFVRDGASWNKVLKNIEYCINETSIELDFAVTLTIPTLLDIKVLLKFLYFYRRKVVFTVCSLGGVSTLYSPLSLDNITLNKIIDDTIEHIRKKYSNGFFSDLVELLEGLKGRDVGLPAEEIVRESVKRSDNLDLYLKRKNLFEYYKNYSILDNWLKNIESLCFVKEEPVVLPSQDESYWKAQHCKDMESTSFTDISHSYSRELLQNLEVDVDYVSLIGSYPSLFNQALSKDNSKFEMYNDLCRASEFQNLLQQGFVLEKIKVLNVADFIFRKHKSKLIVKPLIKIFDFIPMLNNIFAFHVKVLLRVKRDN